MHYFNGGLWFGWFLHYEFIHTKIYVHSWIFIVWIITFTVYSETNWRCFSLLIFDINENVFAFWSSDKSLLSNFVFNVWGLITIQSNGLQSKSIYIIDITRR